MWTSPAASPVVCYLLGSTGEDEPSSQRVQQAWGLERTDLRVDRGPGSIVRSGVQKVMQDLNHQQEGPR